MCVVVVIIRFGPDHSTVASLNTNSRGSWKPATSWGCCCCAMNWTNAFGKIRNFGDRRSGGGGVGKSDETIHKICTISVNAFAVCKARCLSTHHRIVRIQADVMAGRNAESFTFQRHGRRIAVHRELRRMQAAAVRPEDFC